MAENMTQVLERLRKEKQNSQPSKTEKAPTPKIETPKEIEGLDLDDDDYSNDKTPELDLKPNEEKPNEETPEKRTIEQQIAMEIELLQNNGRFRVEMLHQLHELNRALVGIAEILVNLSEKNG